MKKKYEKPDLEMISLLMAAKIASDFVDGSSGVEEDDGSIEWH